VHVRSFAKAATPLSGCPRNRLAPLNSRLSPDRWGCRITTCSPGVLSTFSSQVRRLPAGLGAEGQNRTGDTMIFSHVLYQLSYLGTRTYCSRASRPPGRVTIAARKVRTMRFVYNDPYALRGAVEQLAGQQPVATRRERDLPIPVDVYQQANEIVIEGALPGAELKDLELTCEAGLLTLRRTLMPGGRDFP